MLPGDLIADRYRLTRLLGNGGMGVVWAARNEAIHRDVAIKLMLPRIAEDPASLQRFFNEARICGSIRHPGIVDVIDLGRAEDGSPFLVMELLEGETLGERLDRVKSMPPGVILPIARDIARTIAMAHKRGVIHRDIKPSNVFLQRVSEGEEVVKVLDFGISKVLSPEFETKTTGTGAVLGSPAYMSPERAMGDENLAPQGDVYSLGVILYEALAGRMPYLADNYNALIVDIATTDPDDIAAIAPGLPAVVVALVRDAMARDPSRRIATMDELADRIDQILFGMQSGDPRFSEPAPVPVGGRPSIGSRPSGSAFTAARSSAPGLGITDELVFEPSRRRKPLLLAGLGLGAGVLITIVVVMTRSGPSDSPAGPPEGSQAAQGGAAAPPPPVTAPPPSAATSGLAAAPSASGAPTSPKPTSGGAKLPGSKATPPPKKPKLPGGAWGYD